MFYNYTKLRALYYVVEQGSEDEIEFKEFIRNEDWKREKLCELVEEELVDHIISNIQPTLQEEANAAWWITQISG